MMQPILLLCLLFSTTCLVLANVEKTVFLAPPRSLIPSSSTLHDRLSPARPVRLERLSPEKPVVRTRLNASFPSTSRSTDGTISWLFLEGLNPGQRYEVRVCYMATQPTAFHLDTFSLESVMQDASLLASISEYAHSQHHHHSSTNAIPRTNPDQASTTTDSILFLRILATAEYFSLDPHLMQHVPPVMVDVILDPFLGNVFPRSLVPTAMWMVVVACGAVCVARWVVYREVEGLVRSVCTDDLSGKDGKKMGLIRAATEDKKDL